MGAHKHHHHHRHHRRLLAYAAAAVPEGGAAVYRSTTALTLSYGKDAAGHPFHLVALKQAGLYGAWAGKRGAAARPTAAGGRACHLHRRAALPHLLAAPRVPVAVLQMSQRR